MLYVEHILLISDPEHTTRTKNILVKNEKQINKRILIVIELKCSFAIIHKHSKNATGINKRRSIIIETIIESVKSFHQLAIPVFIKIKVNNAAPKKAIVSPIFVHR